jgi:hypothetical protein
MKALAWLLGGLLVALLAWGSFHMLIPPVNPTQQPPKQHVQSSCWTCHFVSSSAKITTPTP